jgi:hypothetical protein
MTRTTPARDLKPGQRIKDPLIDRTLTIQDIDRGGGYRGRTRVFFTDAPYVDLRAQWRLTVLPPEASDEH